MKISVGAELARRLVWKSETIRCALAFGSGRDAGKIRVAIDMTAGQFMARRDARGNYALTLNAKTCEGLFALEFPEFAVPEIAPVEAMGTPPALVFAASAEMLAAE